MSKRAKIILLVVVVVFAAVLAWLGSKNKQNIVSYKTETAFKATIVKKTVATGKVIPLEEIEIKPQITGIIDQIYLLEGAKVKKGDLIATVRVVPNEQSLLSAKGRVDNIKLRVKNAKIAFDRNKQLFDKGVLAASAFEQIELTFDQAKQDLINAENDYKIIKSGSSGVGVANTDIRAQILSLIHI